MNLKDRHELLQTVIDLVTQKIPEKRKKSLSVQPRKTASVELKITQ